MINNNIDLKILERIRSYVNTIQANFTEFGIVQHPLFSMSMVQDLSISNKNNQFIELTVDNLPRFIEQRFTEMKKAITTDKTIYDKIETIMSMFITKPYRLPIFTVLIDLLSNKEYSKILINLWVDTEWPHQNGVDSMLLLFDKSNIIYMLNKKEQQTYNKMNEIVTVYRGLQKDAISKGLSWTTDKLIAIWFAKRFDYNGKLLKAKIKKKYIYAY